MKKINILLFIVLFYQLSLYAQDKDTSALEKNVSFNDSPKEAARKKIEAYRQRVLDGESMATVAALYTDDPGSARTGGRYDNIARGQFVPEFEAVAFNLNVGDISEVFETKFGFHFVQLIARRGDIIDVRHILVVPK